MEFLRFALSTLALLLIGVLPGLAQERTFNHPGLAGDADRYETYLKGAFKAAAPISAEQRRAALEKARQPGEARAVANHLATVVIHKPDDAEAWTGLAAALLAIPADPQRGGERYSIPVNASGAAYRAMQRASRPAQKAAALIVLADALKRRSMWRPAIDALAASLSIAETESVRQAYDALRAEHGFRVVDYKTDSDATEPRLCINFSERLPANAGDLGKFVSVDGAEAASLVAEGERLCIDGLAHGKRYEVQLRAGLPSAIGETLPKAAEIGVYVRDRSASVRFTGRAYVLPNRGQQGIPVVSVNTDKVAIEILRIGDRGLTGAQALDGFLKQVPNHELETIRERSGKLVWQGDLAVKSRLNEDVTTAIPVSDALPRLEPGVYLVSAHPAGTREGRDNRATQWFIVSDLGLTAMSGDDGLHVLVRSLASAEARDGITVRLVARNNEVLGTVRTDGGGYARFDAGYLRGQGGQAPAILVAETGTDYAFLDLATAAFDLTDRGVKGRESPGPLDAYLYTDRGVYRPGEPVHLTALLRNRNGVAVTAVPTTLIISRPDGVEHRRIALTDQGLGGRTTALALAASAMTGTWRARLHADPKDKPLAQLAFLVEDFVPERLDMTLTPQAKAMTIEQTTAVDVAGRFLYGTPASDLALEGDIIVRPSSGDVEGFPGYRFGQADERITAVRKPLEGLPRTASDGRARIDAKLPPIPRTARPLEALVQVRLREPGGRAIERRVVLPVQTGEPRIGIKPLFKGNEVGEGETAEFDAVLVGADGATVQPAKLKWELVRLDRRWQWYSRDGQWSYEAVTTTRRLATGAADSSSEKPARIASRLDWGRYRLEVTSEDGRTLASTTFNAGWHASDAVDSPELLDVALDKPTYKSGDTARVRITSRYAGKVRISVLGSGLLASKDADIPAGGGEIALPVDEAWMPGAYVTAVMYRPMDEVQRRMPSRAIGVKWLALDTAARTLSVTMSPPAKVKPATTVTVPVRIGGLNAGEQAYLTLAAVDVGILNLTRFESPAPEKWLYAQRRLGVEIRDFYGRLIDGMRAERGALRSGGDGPGSNGMSTSGKPPVEKPLALFSGLVKVGPDGTVAVDLALPEFNGTVRLMAVAWSAEKVGSAAIDMIVRDALALTVSAPRFLTLGDEARLQVDLHNLEGPEGAYDTAVTQETASGSGSSLARRAVQLATGARASERIALKPVELGRTTFTVRIAGPGGIAVQRSIALVVNPPSADIKRMTVSALAARGGRLSVTRDLTTDLIPSTARVMLSVGPTAALDVAGLLTQLDRYPYGCAEQTTSRALPLLYVNDVARRIGIAADQALRERVAKAIDRVLEMQDSTGAFGVWGPDNTDLWLTSYVTDFLTRAREAGYTVPAQAFNQALDRLANYINYAQDFESGGEQRAYALYVLARNGRQPVGELRYYADTRLERFSTPLARAQLGAALAMIGDNARAERAFRSALTMMGEDDLDGGRADYGSKVRDGAAVLTLASETGVLKNEATGLAQVVARAYQGRQYTSTQEQAWMLLAAHSLVEQTKRTALTVAGAPHAGELTRTVTASDLAAGPLAVVNTGPEPVDAVVSVLGSSLTPEPAVAKGFTIERTYYTLDGKKVEPAADGGLSIAQNDRLIVVLKIKGEESGGRILLVDRLPAGLEIENPRLVDSGDVKSLDWLKATRPAHSEFRDDRFVTAFDFFGRNGSAATPEATVAYMVRAVTPGRYVHPAATVEDMYRPDRFARTGGGRLDVTAR